MDALITVDRERLAATLAPRGGGADRRSSLLGAESGSRPVHSEEASRAVEDTDAAMWRDVLARRTPCARAGPPAGLTVCYADRENVYPEQLRRSGLGPPALFMLGGSHAASAAARSAALSTLPCVAIVGARRPSTYGLEMAASLGRQLADRGVCVVSGLAEGIDAAAHRGALLSDATSGGGHVEGFTLRTVAVLGTGVDVCYPRRHRALYERLIHEGLVVSQFPWGTQGRAWRFPARNAVMAGLCHAVVVVEGDERSGALITGRLAQRAGIPVLAVPGEAGRRLSCGPHSLLRAGALLCESAVDVVACLRGDHVERAGGGDAPSGMPPSGARLREQSVSPECLMMAAPSARADPMARGGRPAGGDQAPCAPVPVQPRGDGAGQGDRPSLHEALAALVDAGPVDVGTVVESLGLDIADALAALTELEVRGMVRIDAGGSYRAVRGAVR